MRVGNWQQAVGKGIVSGLEIIITIDDFCELCADLVCFVVYF
jgi:hypothetical protein